MKVAQTPFWDKFFSSSPRQPPYLIKLTKSLILGNNTNKANLKSINQSYLYLVNGQPPPLSPPFLLLYVSLRYIIVPLFCLLYIFIKMCLYFFWVSIMDQTFFCYNCIVYIVYVWPWSSAPFVSELCVRRTSDESRHSRAINAMYHSLRSKNRQQDVMSCH